MTYQIRPTVFADWCLVWKTSAMPDPAYWYYKTEQDATDAAHRLQKERHGTD
jgi:hypothetical protein